MRCTARNFVVSSFVVNSFVSLGALAAFGLFGSCSSPTPNLHPAEPRAFPVRVVRFVALCLTGVKSR